MRRPLVVGGATETLWDRDYLARHRVRLTSTGHQPFNVAVEALHAAMKAVLEGTPSPRLAGAASGALMGTATRDSDYKLWIRKFLVPGE